MPRLTSGMSLRKWHKGKLMILWAWGGVAVALAMTDFLTQPVQSEPMRHLVELLFSLIVLLALLPLHGTGWEARRTPPREGPVGRAVKDENTAPSLAFKACQLRRQVQRFCWCGGTGAVG